MDACEDRGGWAGWLSEVEKSLGAGSAAWLGRIAAGVIDRARLRPGEAVADLGAGTGLLTLAAARVVGRSGRVFSVDASESCLKALRESASRAGLENIVTLAAPLEALPIDTSTCDAVVCRSALAYLTGLSKAVGEISRVLAAGGRFSVFEPLLAETGFQTGGSLGEHEPEFEAMQRTLREARASYSLDRAMLRGAFEDAGLTDFMSLPVRFPVNMSGRGEEDILGDFLRDLPGELAASHVLKTAMDEDRMMDAARAFARAAAAGRVKGWVWCMFLWGAAPA